MGNILMFGGGYAGACTPCKLDKGLRHDEAQTLIVRRLANWLTIALLGREIVSSDSVQHRWDAYLASTTLDASTPGAVAEPTLAGDGSQR